MGRILDFWVHLPVRKQIKAQATAVAVDVVVRTQIVLVVPLLE